MYHNMHSLPSQNNACHGKSNVLQIIILCLTYKAINNEEPQHLRKLLVDYYIITVLIYSWYAHCIAPKAELKSSIYNSDCETGSQSI